MSGGEQIFVGEPGSKHQKIKEPLYGVLLFDMYYIAIPSNVAIFS